MLTQLAYRFDDINFSDLGFGWGGWYDITLDFSVDGDQLVALVEYLNHHAWVSNEESVSCWADWTITWQGSTTLTPDAEMAITIMPIAHTDPVFEGAVCAEYPDYSDNITDLYNGESVGTITANLQEDGSLGGTLLELEREYVPA